MLYVKTFIAPSTIPGAGDGLFAAQDIPSGTLIWDFNPDFDRAWTQDEFALLDERYQAFVQKFAYFSRRSNRYIMCCDNARFFNHSDTPSVFTQMGAVEEFVDYAPGLIQAGTELTCDYSILEGKKPLF